MKRRATSFPSIGSGGGVAEILAIGGTIPDGIVLAVAASAVVSSKALVGNYGLLVDWFPDVHGGFHVGVLAGAGHVAIPEVVYPLANGGSSSGGTNASGFAAGGTLLAGYDLWVSPQCSLGLNVLASATTPVRVQDPFDDVVNPVWVGLTASVLYH